ncbi:MAG TPA: endolytic transglycosylase MltG [Actinocatenispora sp.]
MLDGLDLAYEESDARPGRHRRRKKRRGRTVFALAMVLVLFACLGGGAVFGWTKIRGFFVAPDYSGQGSGTAQVQVHTGDSAADIGNTLYGKGVVKSAKAFVDAAGDNPHGTEIQPGYYSLHKQMKASLAVTALLDLKNRISTKVTLPEGLTVNATLKRLSTAMKLPLSDFQQAAKDPKALGIGDNWFVRNDKKKAAKTVEGFLYPDTYMFDPGTTAKEALQEMVQHFMKAAADSGLDKGANGMSPYELLISASMVQAEAGIESDMPKVARVIYNRLGADEFPWLKKLHFDSTTNYWLDLKGKGAKVSSQLTQSELNDPDNPYSTTVYEGLPPGPIDSPSLAAMNGTVKPASGNWFYFVVIDKSGKSAFTNSSDQHERNIEEAKRNGVG